MEAPPEGKTTRVLVVGDVDDAAQLQAKQTSVMKQQSFDLVLCAGRFKGGGVKMPLPTYYFGDTEAKSDEENNVHFLGTNGVATVAGLQIAFISDSASFPKAQREPVDVALSAQWPSTLLTHVTGDVAEDVRAKVAGGKQMSELLHQLAPRYLFVAAGLYYERLPWITRMQTVARFFALAPLNNTVKAKSVYAFGIVGLRASPKAAPLPPLHTPDPFAAPVTVPSESGDRKRRRRDENLEGSRDCWFCLQNPNCDVHLLVSVGKEMYLALAKGGVVDEHLLVVPIYHYSAAAALPSNIAGEMRTYIDQLSKMYATRDMNVCVFERVLPGGRPHAQVNVVPVPKQFTADKISAVLLSHGIASRVSFSAVDANVPLEQLVGPDEYYFVFEIHQGKNRQRYLQKIVEGTQHPMQFGREVLCKLLNVPDRLDWRSCQLAKPQAMKLAAEFRERFKPYDSLLYDHKSGSAS